MNKQKYDKHFHKGLALYEKGHYREAIQEYQEAIRYNDKDITARLDIVNCYIELEAIEPAKNSLKNLAPRIGGNRVSGLYYRLWAKVAAEEEKYDVALACIKLAQRVSWTISGFLAKRWLRHNCKYRGKVALKDIVPLMKSYGVPVIFQIRW